MRVRGWHTDVDYDNESDDSTKTWGDQRLRLGGKIAVAEGVSITFRTDITESNWGNTSPSAKGEAFEDQPTQGNGFGSGRSGAAQQWDRAHLDLTKGNFHLRAGQQYVGTGGTFAVDTQDNGLSFDYVISNVAVNAFFIVDNDGGSKKASDTLLSGLKADFKGDNFSAKLFVANQSKGSYNSKQFDRVVGVLDDVTITDTDGRSESVTLVGVSSGFDLGPVKLFAELDYFTGDSFTITGTDEGVAFNEELDAMGTQLFVDASIAASDAFTVGGQVFYALGDDEDQQITRLGNGFNGWDPIMDVGTSLSNEEITFGSAFNIAANNSANASFNYNLASAGMVGGRLYTGFKASDALSFGASAAYLTEEDDTVVEVSTVALAGGMVYKIMENTSIQLQLQYTDGDVTLYDAAGTKVVDDESFNSFRAGSGIFVNF